MSRLAQLDQSDFTDAQRLALAAAVYRSQAREQQLLSEWCDCINADNDHLCHQYDRFIEREAANRQALNELLAIAERGLL